MGVGEGVGHSITMSACGQGCSCTSHYYEPPRPSPHSPPVLGHPLDTEVGGLRTVVARPCAWLVRASPSAVSSVATNPTTRTCGAHALIVYMWR